MARANNTPAQKKAQERTASIRVRLHPDAADRIRAYARATGRSVSGYVADLLEATADLIKPSAKIKQKR